MFFLIFLNVGNPFLLALLFGLAGKQMKWLMQWQNLLPNLELVLIVICPLCPRLYGYHGGMMFFVRFLNEVAILITKKQPPQRVNYEQNDSN
jgi:hypothetical protein